MRTIPLTQGQVAFVDDEDYERIAIHNWHVARSKDGRAYARRRISKSPWCVLMHREVVGAPPEKYVDHINGCGLDNRRHNLRLAENYQNQGNRKRGREWRGITKHRASGLWFARIKEHRKERSLGYYKTPQEAAKAYDAAAKIHFGEFARLNFP